MAQSSLSYKFRTADILSKIIVVNAAIFIVVTITSALMQWNPWKMVQWFILPDSFMEFLFQPWSIFTYSFIHTGFFHVLFNMLWLYFFGRHVLNLFSEKRFLTLYLLGALAGGIVYMVSYNLFPAFQNTIGTLQGASASIMAIMVFAAVYSPNTEVRIFTFRLKLWHIAAFFVILDLVRLPSMNNAGGLLAHLGGAAFGYIYARQLLKGKDIGVGFERLLDWFFDLFKSRKQKPFKKVHRNQTTQKKSGRSTTKEGKSTQQQKIDAILDKIGKSGYESLTKAEKEFLFRAGKDN